MNTPTAPRKPVAPNGTRKSSTKSARSRAREFALQGLYQHFVGGGDVASIDAFTRELQGFNKADAVHYDALLRGCIENEAALEAMKHYHVQPEAWAPLGGGRHNPYQDALLQGIADAHQKTIAQVVLRWNVQRGVTVIPKSTRQERIEENFAIWDFSLTEKEMAQISSLDLGYVGESVKHFNPEFVRGCLAVKIHD